MTAIAVAEAARELNLRKGQTIALADAGVLTYVCDGKSGKCRTVTLDSVWAAKKADPDELLASISKTTRKAENTSAVAEKAAEGADVRPDELKSVLGALGEILSEIRQLKGIVCSRVPMHALKQGELEIVR